MERVGLLEIIGGHRGIIGPLDCRVLPMYFGQIVL